MPQEWIHVRDELPPEDLEVMTKIDDDKGYRNETTLTLARNLWWYPDKSMYVYYNPTHWKLLEDDDAKY
jgi:hypothetical protein